MSSGLDLVTGGAGFIGSHLVQRLLEDGRRVRIIDNLSTGRRANIEHLLGSDKLEFVEADISVGDVATSACVGVDRVYHLAALADIVPSIDAPTNYFRANVDGTFSVLEASRAAKVTRFVYAASSSCYGIPVSFPTPESAPSDPRYPYALTKFLGEQMVIHWARVYRMPAVSLRFFNVYGPRARTTGSYGAVFGVFLGQLLAGEPLTVVGNGEQTRDFTYVSDVVSAMIAAAASAKSGEVYNIGTGRPESVNRLVSLLNAERTVHLPKRPGEPDCTMADIRKFVNDTGWQPAVTFEQGVQIMLDNIEDWRSAPVWTVQKIEEATAGWFEHMS